VTDVTILADDLSGAAETAAAFLGRRTALSLDLSTAQPDRPGVTVVDLDTRTSSAGDADRALRSALDRIEPGRLVMHKIDSLLRGHVGAAVCTLAERGPVVVAAGLPALGRLVRDGVLYVDGVPLHRSDLWHLEAVAPPRSLGELFAHTGVTVCEVASDADLDALVAAAPPCTQLAGTSALAAAIARTLPVDVAESVDERCAAAVLVVVGTGAPNAASQVAVLVERGAAHVELDADDLLCCAGVPFALTAPLTVVTVAGAVPAARRHELSIALGRFVAAVCARADLVLTGGETARSVIDALGVTTLRPTAEVHHGAVVSRTADGRRVVTRPGSFGDVNSLAAIAAHLSPPHHSKEST